MRELIVLTCTIKPTSITRTKRLEPELRLADYTNSINSWLKFTSKRKYDLLIIENSDSVDLLRKFESNENFSIMPVKKDTRSVNEGISGGEFEMLKLGLTDEILNKYEVIWKVTGRNYVSNAEKVLKFDYESNLMCERNVFPRHSCDSRVFGMKRDTWKEFLGLNPTFRNDKQFNSAPHIFDSMEHLLTIFATNLEFSGGRQTALKNSPIIFGFSGSTNKEIMSRKRRILLRIQTPFRPIINRLLLGISP